MQGNEIPAKRIDKVDSVKEGWATLKSNFEIIFAAFVFMLIVSFLMQMIGQRPIASYTESGIDPPLNVALFTMMVGISDSALSMIFQMGFTKILLKIIRGQKAFFNDIVSCYKLFFKYLFGNILYLLIVMFGALFLIIAIVAVTASPELTQALTPPNDAGSAQMLIGFLLIVAGTILVVSPMVYLSIRYGYFAVVIVDKELGPIDSLKESARITEGAVIEILLFNLFLLLFNFLGMLVFFVGLLVTIPTSIIAYMIVYRSLLNQTDAEDHANDVAIEEEISDNAHLETT